MSNWPVQLALVPPGAPFLRDADLLIAADCVAFAMPDFHEKLARDRAVVIACPKLDDRLDAYVQKLEAIFRDGVRSVTVAHMEVPCCGGIVRAVKTALARAGKDAMEFHDVTVGIDGSIRSQPALTGPDQRSLP